MCLPPWALAALAGKSDFPNPVVGGSERQGAKAMCTTCIPTSNNDPHVEPKPSLTPAPATAVRYF